MALTDDDFLSDPLGYSSGSSKLTGAGGLGGLGGFQSFMEGSGGDMLLALGMSLMSAKDRRTPFANLPQTLALAQSMSEKTDTAKALEMALVAAGYTPEQAKRASSNPAVAKILIDQKQNERFAKMDPESDLAKMNGGSPSSTSTKSKPASSPMQLGPLSNYDEPANAVGGNGVQMGLAPSMVGQPLPTIARSASDDPMMSNILNLARKDSGNNYGALTYKKDGTPGGSADLENMTVAEVMDLQRKMPSMGHASTAVGGYQMIAPTLARAVEAVGLDPATTKFDRATQDLLASQLVKDRGYDDFRNGKLDAKSFADNLSQEWSILQGSNGRGAYDGRNGNRASVPYSALTSALAPQSGGMVRSPVAAMDDPMERRPQETNDRMPVAGGMSDLMFNQTPLTARHYSAAARDGNESNSVAPENLEQERVRRQRMASLENNYVASRQALGNGGRGISQISEEQVVPASRAYDQVAQAPSVSYNDAMRARPAGNALVPTATDAAPSMNPLTAARQQAANVVKVYGRYLDQYAAANKTPPTTWVEKYKAAQRILEPTEIEMALKAAGVQEGSADWIKAMRKKAGIGPSEFDDKLDRAFPNPNDPRRQQAAMMAVQMGPSEASKKLDEMMQRGLIKPGEDYVETGRTLYGVKDDTPADIRSARAWKEMTPEEQKAYREQQEAKRPVQNTVINNVANPLLKGGSEEADDIIKTGRESARGIYTLHEARKQLDKPGGIISGFGSDYVKNGQRIAAFFGADPSKVVNTETYVSTVGQAVLNQAKALGANPSNEDARRINQILGGTTELNEKTMRNILDFQESLLRRKVREANDVIDQYTEVYSDQPELMKSLKARRIKEPAAYEKPKEDETAPRNSGASDASVPKVFTRPQYNALKPGDQYMDPHGNLRVKGGQ